MTRYEIAARHPDGRALLIGYSPRLSRDGLLAAMRKQGRAIIIQLSIGEDDEFTFTRRPRPHCRVVCRATSAASWWIGFTGRTQNEARNSALPFVGNVNGGT